VVTLAVGDPVPLAVVDDETEGVRLDVPEGVFVGDAEGKADEAAGEDEG